MKQFESDTPQANDGAGTVNQSDGGLTPEEVKRLRRFLKAFPDEASADQAVELLETYRAMGRVGRLFLGVMKVLAVVSAGVLAYFHLRGLGWGKGGN